MSLRSKFLRGGLLLSVGQVLSQGMSVARNILVARLIDTESDFGVASTLIMVVMLNELLTNIGMNTVIIQDREGNEPHFLNVAHFIAFIRGIIGALLLLGLSYPIAMIFGIPHATWAFSALAVVPLLRGLAHYDVFRVQRDHSFLPYVTQDILGQLISLACCAPFLWYFHGYKAVLYILILQTLCTTILSHLVAKRPYRWTRDPVIERRIMDLGFPLLLNGSIFFFNTQGERIAVGSSGQLFSTACYTMKDMAAFSAALMIATIAPLVIIRILNSLFVPLLSHGETTRFIDHNELCVQSHAFAGIIVATPLIIFSNTIVRIVYGDRYATAIDIIYVLSCSQAILTLRAGVNVQFIARGDMWKLLTNSLWRISAFPACLLIARAGLPAPFIAIPAIGAEVIAVLLLAWQAKILYANPVINTIKPLMVVVSGIFAAVMFRLFQNDSVASPGYLVIGFVFYVGLSLLLLAFLPALASRVNGFIFGSKWRHVGEESL